MHKQRTYGDHCILFVAADLLSIRVKVLKATAVLEIEPLRCWLHRRDTGEVF